MAHLRKNDLITLAHRAKCLCKDPTVVRAVRTAVEDITKAFQSTFTLIQVSRASWDRGATQCPLGMGGGLFDTAA